MSVDKTKMVIDRKKDHPCFGCAYAKKRPEAHMSITSPWFVCRKPIKVRKPEILGLIKELGEKAEHWLNYASYDTQKRKGLASLLKIAQCEFEAVNRKLDTELDKIYQMLSCDGWDGQWSEPVPMDTLDPECYDSKGCYRRFSWGEYLKLSDNLVPLFQCEQGSAEMVVSVLEDTCFGEVYLINNTKKFKNGLYAIKYHVFEEDPSELDDYEKFVKKEGCITVAGWKKFWTSRGYKTYFQGKEINNEG